ncbi:MAG: hypothetical protein KKD86_13240, partial [Bacteroidetes bacterium]|nr:hypothetical protein [Bacteroidota bacterium]
EKMNSFKAGWADVCFIKLGVFVATLLVAKLWTQVLSLDWYWYLIVWIIAAIKPVVSYVKWWREVSSN